MEPTLNKWENAQQDLVFADFVLSADLSINRQAVLSSCRNIQRSQGTLRSNVGGFQSPIAAESDDPVIEELQETVNEFSLKGVNELGWNFTKVRSAWWINVNTPLSYNVPHTHGKIDLIGVYYVQVPENSGTFNILRNDGMTYTSLVANENQQNPPFNSEWESTPVEGRYYLFPGYVWHYVMQNQTVRDRISISFNLEEA